MQNHLSISKKIFFSLLSLILITPLASHGAGADGLFGDYFSRMTGPCNTGFVLTGFSTTPGTYGTKTCTSIATILGTQFGTATAPAGQAVIGFNIDGTLRYGAVGSSDAPVGAVMAFNLATCPVGWLPANGTNGTLDLRGEFIRGLDSGRGVDVGRTLGSYQGDAMRNLTGKFRAVRRDGGDPQGVFFNDTQTYRGSDTGGDYNNYTGFDASRQVPVANEFRPRNVALLYCQKITSSLPSTNTGVTWTNISGTSAGNVTLATTGNVGIGVATPTAKLEVAGQVKITGGTPGLGKVLTSDASGLATWTTPLSATQVCPGTGTDNVCYGTGALGVNTTGSRNISMGGNSLGSNTGGVNNTAIGYYSLFSNIGGTSNTALGSWSLRFNTTGINNTAIGHYALSSNINGINNVALGLFAGSNLVSGNSNIFIGDNVQPISNIGSNQLNIGNWIYGNAGNIGIGVPNPTQKLDIAGSVKLTGTLTGLNLVATSRISAPELCIGGVCKTNWESSSTPTGGGYRNYYSARGGKGTGYQNCYTGNRGTQYCTDNYFETTDWTKSLGPTDNTTLGFFPTSNPKKVDIRVADREWDDWPAVGTVWSFGPGMQYPFDQEIKVYEGNNNRLWLTVRSDGNIRYRGEDYSGGYGGVHIYTEAYY